MKNDKYWRNLFIIMLCLMIVPLIALGEIDFNVTFYFMWVCLAGIVVLIVLMGSKYKKGVYTKKEYVKRALSLYIPYLFFPVYTFVRVWIYYLITQDSDPLGYLWVMEVLPQTILFLLVGGIIVLVTALTKNNRAEA